MPKAPERAIKIFYFFLEAKQYKILAGGMSHHMVGLDTLKVGELGEKYYNIDLSKYMYFFKIFEQKILQQQQQQQRDK